MNRYAHLQEPEDELDFHGLGPLGGAEIKARTTAFLEAARRRGLRRVRIVTGKGVHSKRTAVVRPQVLRTLRGLEDAGIVTDFRSEKVGRGGEGAFFVTLA